MLATGLALTACSGGSEEPPDTVPGVDSGSDEESDPKAGVPSAGEEEESGEGEEDIERPHIELPEDMENVFEDTDTGDATKDAIIRDVVYGINSVDMAISLSDPDHPAVAFYNTGDGHSNAKSYIRGGVDNERSWSGRADYYSFAVANEDRRAKEPIVSYCIDKSGVHTKELQTGEVLPKPGDAIDFTYSQVIVHEDERGIWQVTGVLPRDETGDQACAR